MLLDAAVLTIIVGVIAGGRLGRLKDLDLRAPAAFIAAAALQVLLMVLGVRRAAMPPAPSVLSLVKISTPLPGSGSSSR